MGRKDDIEAQVLNLLKENDRRRAVLFGTFNPITGEGSVGKRVAFTISDFPIATQYLPVEMMDEPFVKELQEAGSVHALVKKVILGSSIAEIYEEAYNKIVEQFVRIRIKYDFPFWAASFVYIKRKGGGKDILFRLNRPQRRLVERFEKMRKAGKPIRLDILKARQWGGSTCTQMYMAWLQLVHEVGLNSLIIAHQSKASDKIKAMFDKMIKAYPVQMLHDMGDIYEENEKKIIGIGKSGSIYRVPQRNCDINIGTAESPNADRSGDYNLVHMSEVGLYPKTDKMNPESIVRGSLSGILYEPNTMIVLESTADGVGTFFHKEYLAAKKGESQYESIFVSWFEIEQYRLEFKSKAEKIAFARWLYVNRNNDEVKSDREEPGTYLWWLWTLGATLEGIHWYVQERTKYTNHGDMASEYPSDDIEAFTFIGRKVFQNEDVEQFRDACRPPRMRGEIYGKADEGEEALEGIRFRKEKDGRLFIYHDVEKDTEEDEILDRYLVVVDVCKGHTKNADYADILVLDRLYMMDGEPPVVAAEWHGHIDMDRLAWKAAQVAEYYNHALLVIESNTLETNNTKGEAEYILTLIADVYDNLYARKQSAEDIRQGLPKKYGYHTNVLTKKVVILNLQVAVREHLYIEHESECLDEFITYVETDKGGYEAMEGYHDDRLMTRAIGLQVCFHEMDLPRVVKHDRFKVTTPKVVSEATI